MKKEETEILFMLVEWHFVTRELLLVKFGLVEKKRC